MIAIQGERPVQEFSQTERPEFGGLHGFLR
jgi:hypothetical protein